MPERVSRFRTPRSGFSLMEVVVATLFLAAVALPLFELLEGGIRRTRATIHEVRGTHLAAEIAEQVETIPFEVLSRMVTDTRVLSSQEDSREGELVDGASLEGSDYSFHLSPLPPGFQRSLNLTRTAPDLILAIAKVDWKQGKLPARSIQLRRFLARDSLLP